MAITGIYNLDDITANNAYAYLAKIEIIKNNYRYTMEIHVKPPTRGGDGNVLDRHALLNRFSGECAIVPGESAYATCYAHAADDHRVADFTAEI